MPLSLKRSSSFQHYIPIAYVKTLIYLLEEQDIKILDVYKTIGINYKDLIDPTGRIPFQKFANLIELITTVIDDENLGISIGMSKPLTIHGNVGLAMICSATFGSGLEVLRRFWHLRNQAVDLRYSEEQDWAIFEFHPTISMSNDVKRVFIDSLLAMFHSGVVFAFGKNNIGQEIWFDYASSLLPDHLVKHLPTLLYNKSTPQYRIPKTLLNYPLPTASQEGLNIALELCERELQFQKEENNNLLEKTRAAMILGESGYPSFSQLAMTFGLSERTYRRRLTEYKSSYHRIRDEARHRDGIHFLENTTLGIQDIASLIGFAEPANFTRAFRERMGVSPKIYRKKLLNPESE